MHLFCKILTGQRNAWKSVAGQERKRMCFGRNPIRVIRTRKYISRSAGDLHLYSDMGFLELDGLHTGLVRGSQLGFITKIFPLGVKPEEIRTYGATQIQLGPLKATLGDRLNLENAVCKPQL